MNDRIKTKKWGCKVEGVGLEKGTQLLRDKNVANQGKQIFPMYIKINNFANDKTISEVRDIVGWI